MDLMYPSTTPSPVGFMQSSSHCGPYGQYIAEPRASSTPYILRTPSLSRITPPSDISSGFVNDLTPMDSPVARSITLDIDE